jgi:hypothetical protein
MRAQNQNYRMMLQLHKAEGLTTWKWYNQQPDPLVEMTLQELKELHDDLANIADNL